MSTTCLSSAKPTRTSEERQVERLVPVAEAAHGMRAAGLMLRNGLDARTLQPAMHEPPRALFVATKPRL